MLARVIVALNGIMFFLYGGLCLFDPNTPATLTSVHIIGSSGMVETSAMYGGLQLAMGIFLVLSTRSLQRTVIGLEVLAYIMGGLGLARAVGISVYGADSYNVGVASYEILCCVLVCYLRHRLATTVTEY